MVAHEGRELHVGHFHCLARASSGVWHRFDDDKVRQASARQAVGAEAYLLFYVRTHPPARGAAPALAAEAAAAGGAAGDADSDAGTDVGVCDGAAGGKEGNGSNSAAADGRGHDEEASSSSGGSPPRYVLSPSATP